MAELPLVTLITAFFIGGISAGVTFGLLWRLVKRTSGAWLVGMLAAIPFFLVIRVAVKGLSDWTDGDLVRLIAVSAAWAIGTAGLFAVGFYRR